MIIKSEKGLPIAYIICVFPVWLGGFVYMILYGEILLGCMLIVAGAYLFSSLLIFNCRTLIMDSEGCTVCLGRFRKKYAWKELQTKRLEYYCQSGLDPRRGVVFSTKRIGSMNRRHPSKYAGLKPLFSCFYVCFKVSEDERTSKSDSVFEIKYYEVDEQEFMGKMREWKVRIENGLPPEKRKKYPYDWA